MEIVPANNIFGRPNARVAQLPLIKPILTKHWSEQGLERVELMVGQALTRGLFEGSVLAHVATPQLMPNRFLG